MDREGLWEFLLVTFSEDEERKSNCVVQGGTGVMREKAKRENVSFKLQDNLMFNGKGKTTLYIPNAFSDSNHQWDRQCGHRISMCQNNMSGRG